MLRLGLCSALVSAVSFFAVAPVVHAQGYPQKPVRMVAGNIGSGADYIARYIGTKLSERWGKSIVIDNRQAILGSESVAKAAPDGYTLLMGQLSSHGTAPAVYKSLAYDPIRDFTPIVRTALAPLVLVSHPAIPATNVRDLVTHLRQRPGAVRAATQSGASNGRLTLELFSRAAGVETLQVPYKSPGASVNALLAQETQVSFLVIPMVMPHVQAGRLNALAVTSGRRFSGTPDIPTMAEGGIRGVESFSWFGVFGPAKMPRELVTRLNRDIADVLRAPDTAKSLMTQGMEPAPGTPEELAAFVSSEIAKWGQIIKAAGIRLD